MAEIVEGIARPSFALLHETGRIREMSAAIAARTFEQALTATVRAQAAAVMPTDTALSARGGPNPDTMRRFMRVADLADLPGVQLWAAAEAGVVDRPSGLTLDARTERMMGPDKFGVLHPQRPPHVRPILGGAPPAAQNTAGALATAVLLAECGPVVIPIASVAIAQGYWDPQTWPVAEQPGAEQALRDRAEFRDTFVTTPHDVVQAIIQQLEAVSSLCPGPRLLDDVAITGGRLQLGQVLTRHGFGAGRRDRHAGCTLSAYRDLRAVGLHPFLVIPRARQAIARPSYCDDDTCDWEFDVNGVRVTLGVLEDRLDHATVPWTPVPPALVTAVAGPGQYIYTFRTMAFSEDLPVGMPITLVLAGEGSRRDLYGTTLSPAVDAELVRIAGLVADERERRRPDSPAEIAMRSLLADCHLQTNRRRRYPERHSFAALTQAAFGVRQYADVA
jgi:hypothetical protein